MARSELPGTLTAHQQHLLFLRVRERDHHRCVLCWTRTDLCVHHFWDSLDRPVIPQSLEKRSPYVGTQIYDLITLCSVCHGKVHSSDWKSPLMGLLRSIIKETYLTNSLEIDENQKKTKVIILDDNPLSIASYLEEFGEEESGK